MYSIISENVLSLGRKSLWPSTVKEKMMLLSSLYSRCTECRIRVYAMEARKT